MIAGYTNSITKLSEGLLGYEVEIEEPFISSLLRLGWLKTSDVWTHERARLSITDLGAALLRADEVTETDHSEVLVLAAGDHMAYISLMGRIAELESPLVVDPYLRVDQLAEILQYTSASRFLIGKNLSAGQVAPMRMVIDAGQETRPAEMRQDESGRLHDRYVISEEASYMFGTSMNSVGQKSTTVLMPLTDVAARAVREEVEEIWDHAETLSATDDREND